MSGNSGMSWNFRPLYSIPRISGNFSCSLQCQGKLSWKNWTSKWTACLYSWCRESFADKHGKHMLTVILLSLLHLFWVYMAENNCDCPKYTLKRNRFALKISWNFPQCVMECQGKVREFESRQSVGTLNSLMPFLKGCSCCSLSENINMDKRKCFHCLGKVKGEVYSLNRNIKRPSHAISVQNMM